MIVTILRLSYELDRDLSLTPKEEETMPESWLPFSHSAWGLQMVESEKRQWLFKNINQVDEKNDGEQKSLEYTTSNRGKI